VKYYSQNGEDCLLWEFFGPVNKGYFIDIGAFDGIHLSNSYSFEQFGWKGICVEAHPEYFSLLKKNRPRSQCLHYACVRNRNTATVEFHMEKMGLLSSVLATDEFKEDVKARYEGRGLPFQGFRSVEVPAITLDELLEKYSNRTIPIDFISLDVEGLEPEVLQGFDAHGYSPRVLVVEANTDVARHEIFDILTSFHNYLFAGRLAENLFFVNNEEDREKIRSIELHCRIEKQSHPLGDEYSTPKYLRGKIIDSTKWNRLVW
jgi:FkbM family methyltransferase